MRLLFIRHAEPDYKNDSLTGHGIEEAKALALLAPELDLGTCYVSPLGRAQMTASYSLEATGKTAETREWLREFESHVHLDPEGELLKAYDWSHTRVKNERNIVWDIKPNYLAAHPEFYHQTKWRESLIAKRSDICVKYDYVVSKFDELLAENGYVRNGMIYDVTKESRETITFFCHLGISCLLIAHMMNCSPFVLWHHTCFLPSSVTEVVTEEREQGKASFRILKTGDLTHLRIAGVEPSFMARFTDVYSDMSLRH